MHVLRSIIQMFIADLYHCNVCDKIKRNMLMLEGAYWNYSLLIFFSCNGCDIIRNLRVSL